MSYSAEFETVDLLTHSHAETRGVDSFALSLIKVERQLRRLFTHLVYQFTCFGPRHVHELREALWRERVYFDGFERGFDSLFASTIQELIGTSFVQLRPRIDEAIQIRNKIFHGQLTERYLSREDLFEFVTDLRTWCELLANAAVAQIGYDGFSRNSFQKSEVGNISQRFKVEIEGIDSYVFFIHQHMRRR